MTTAHNEHTGASLTTAGKGSLEKYAQGWEGIFGAKKTGDEACWEMVNGSSITFKDTGAEPLVGLSSAVMALDFHDSTMYKRIAEKFGFAVQARRDHFRVHDWDGGDFECTHYDTEAEAWKGAYESVLYYAAIREYDLS